MGPSPATPFPHTRTDGSGPPTITQRRSTLQTGLDVFLKNPLPELAGKRVGVLTNTGAVDERMQPSGEAILALEHMKVDRFFAGEHGLY